MAALGEKGPEIRPNNDARWQALKTQAAEAMLKLDKNSDGSVDMEEWHDYVVHVYSSKAERTALFSIVDAYMKMARP